MSKNNQNNTTIQQSNQTTTHKTNTTPKTNTNSNAEELNQRIIYIKKRNHNQRNDVLNANQGSLLQNEKKKKIKSKNMVY